MMRTGVVADLLNEYFVLYTDTTGKTYAICDFLGTDARLRSLGSGIEYCRVVCLGEGSLEEFKDLYDELRERYGYDYTYDEFIEDMSEIYSGTSLDAEDVEPEV